MEDVLTTAARPRSAAPAASRLRLVAAPGRAGLKAFAAVGREIYRPWPHHRVTEDDVRDSIVSGRSVYARHAEIEPHLLVDGDRVVGRACLIHDRKLPDYVMAAWFDAMPGLEGVAGALADRARERFPGVPRLVVGLNAHLNYSAGMLVSPHDEPPVFGFNWTPPYYPAYFEGFEARPMVSFRFDSGPFYEFLSRMEEQFDPGPVRVRPLDRRQLRRDTEIYTHLNNACFGKHPYWSDRAVDEDWELFHPFRFLIRDENLLFAEIDGEPVGFLLWYPDFNELVRRNDESLGLTHLLRYRLRNPIGAVRLTEIACLPQHRRGLAVPAMILRMIRHVREGGYRFCEGGFIFEENRSSVGMALKFIFDAFGRKLEPHRRYAVYEREL